MASKKSKPERFAGLPIKVLHSPNYIRLSAHAKVLLMDIRLQFNGYNNGNLIATWSHMERRGWKSKETLNQALAELLHYGFIERTRKGKRIGGKHHPSLYALTWESIHDCGKGYPARLIPSHAWSEAREPWQRPRRPRRQTDSKIPKNGNRTGQERCA